MPEQLYFVTGMPDTKFYQDNPSQIYTANILKYEKDTLTEVLVLSDSSQSLNYLRYYPSLSTVIVLNENEEKTSNVKSFEILKLSSADLSLEKTEIHKRKIFYDRDYQAYFPSLRLVRNENSINSYLEFFDPEIQRGDTVNPRRIFVLLTNDKYKLTGVQTKGNTIINGSVAGPFFGSNSDLLTLYGHSSERHLVIPSYLEKDSIFNTVIPEDAVLSHNSYSAAMLINNNQIRLLYYRKGKDKQGFYDLYNKAQNRYYQYPFDNSNQNVKQYGDWIAGPTRLQYVDKGTYQGPQPGQDQWNPNDNKYSLSVAEYIDRKLKTMILSGYLAIRNINDPSIFIEWDTKQGDSEILGIHEDIVYYRKHDEVWYVPIVQGKQLGQHEMLLKNEAVPGIHFMFVRE